MGGLTKSLPVLWVDLRDRQDVDIIRRHVLEIVMSCHVLHDILFYAHYYALENRYVFMQADARLFGFF